ncbi:MAG: hypothetical protein P8J34_06220 [Flavobacteriales bacterium]|jgi:hypothetical protein|nr:hypothetical protein [Flavobacteriales bacterium]
MRKLLLLLVTLITFTNVSYASFPVVEKVSDQTTGSMTDPGLSSVFPYYANIWFYIWGIGVFILLIFLVKNLRISGFREKNPFKYLFSGWRRAPWWLYLSLILVYIAFTWWSVLFAMPLLWMALYTSIVEPNL